MLQEFKDFAMKGNVVDLAIGVIIGGAFGKIVDAVVGNIMSIVAAIFGTPDFSNLYVQMAGPKVAAGAALADAKKAGATFEYGTTLTAIVNFLIIAMVLFMVVKALNKMKKAEAASAPAAPPAQEVLLGEIRDLLAKR
jgi:large conductance mechanosensitive channel